MNAREHSVPPAPPRPVRLHGELDPTTRAVAGAHRAHLREALDDGGWVRRGLLGRLTRLRR